MAKILLVEDNPKDLELILYALENTGFSDVDIVKDGQDAADFIFCKGNYANRSPGNPDLILLDMFLPKISGTEILKKIRSDPGTRAIPVIVLTSLRDESTLKECIALNIISYILKPAGTEQLAKALCHAGLLTKESFGKSVGEDDIEIEDFLKSHSHVVDTLESVVKIGVRKAAGTLSMLIGTEIQTDDSIEIKILAADKLTTGMKERIKSESGIRSVSFDFVGGLTGTATFILARENSAILIDAFTKRYDEVDIGDEYSADIFSEIANILISRLVSSFGNLLKKHFNLSAPLYLGSSKSGITVEPNTVILIAQIRFKVGDKYMDGDITLCFRKNYFEMLLNAIKT